MSQRIGNLPANINIMNPVPNKDAKTIMKLIRTNGKISGYQLSDGTVLSKADGVADVYKRQAIRRIKTESPAPSGVHSIVSTFFGERSISAGSFARKHAAS